MKSGICVSELVRGILLPEVMIRGPPNPDPRVCSQYSLPISLVFQAQCFSFIAGLLQYCLSHTHTHTHTLLSVTHTHSCHTHTYTHTHSCLSHTHTHTHTHVQNRAVRCLVKIQEVLPAVKGWSSDLLTVIVSMGSYHLIPKTKL